jgi:alkylated DNA repair dioxygenase AlkB
LGEYDKQRPLHVSGDHPNLLYRGNPLKRSKQWFQTVVCGMLIYLYTGFQYGVAQAQRHVSVVPVVERVFDSLNTLFDLNMNHGIFTLYRDGCDSIGTHQDKLKTIGAEANDFIIVLKLGRFRRPFALSKPKPAGGGVFPSPFFEQQIDPGSLVVMSPYDNEFSVAHSVPETTCGQTSSLVIRNITQWMSDIEFQKKLVACRRCKDTRAKKKAEKRAREE